MKNQILAIGGRILAKEEKSELLQHLDNAFLVEYIVAANGAVEEVIVH